ncbi:alpha/beta fold hydrolase [Massilia niastensis]|uniref:alpha/beta fold hydrolase n=1 Tax=Massilia niastensis TaxID=544911 RepID=UPI000364257F|nr:alpha/beta fold hydrolase [Massilia niastensis]
MKHLPPSHGTVIDGQTFRFSKSGQGSPAIVLLSGAGGPLESWHKLYPGIEKLGTVFSYDRPGVGGSGKPREPQYGEVVVAQLRQLLQAAQVRPPFVLVGHSFGGLHANLFAREFADEVSGVLFLEATAPEDVAAMKRYQSGLQRAVVGLLDRMSPRHPNDEIRNEAETVKDILEAPAFPQVPVTVISGARRLPRWLMPDAAVRERERNQLGLAALSPLGERILAERSTHFPQMSEPELVLEALARLVARTKSVLRG